MKIGFIGLGNMASAMIGGMLSKGVAASNQIIGSARREETLRRVVETYGIQVTTDNVEVAAQADILILAVKPQFLAEVIMQIRDVVGEKTLVISIAAGKSMEWLEACFDGPVKLIRSMPNTPALVMEGCSGICRNVMVTEPEIKQAIAIMESFGIVKEVPESMMDAVMAVSGSAPAYIFMVIEAMADGAVAAGMPRDQAYQFAAQTVLGSARMVLETGKHPGELKDMVCSPGGTTIEAVKVLEKRGLRSAIMEGMEACIRKGKQL